MFDSLSKVKINIYECENALKYIEKIIKSNESNLIVINNKDFYIYKFFFNCKKKNIINEERYFNNNFYYNKIYFVNPEKFNNNINFNELEKNIVIITKNYDLIYFNDKIKLNFEKEHIEYINDEYINYFEKLILIPNFNSDHYDIIFSKEILDLNNHKKKKIIINNKSINLYIKKNKKYHIFFNKLDISEINYIINTIIPKNNNNYFYHDI